MLWHSAVSCQSFKNFSHFCIFLRNDWSDLDQTLIFASCGALCSQLQSFISFSLLCIFLRNYWSSSNFDFCLCCGTLQPVVKVSKISHIFGIFLSNYWSDLDQTLDLCSCCGILQPIGKFPNFLTFLALSLMNYWSDLDQTLIFFMVWHSAATCKVSKFSHFLAFFSVTTIQILIKL